MELWTLDAGDGAATLVRVPGGDTLLVDGGSVATGALLAPWLRRLGVGLPDHVVVTRLDAAHLGGLALLLSGPDGLAGSEDDPVLRGVRLHPGDARRCASLECRGYALLEGGTRARPGDTVDLGGGVTARVDAVASGALDLTLSHGAVVFRIPGTAAASRPEGEEPARRAPPGAAGATLARVDGGSDPTRTVPARLVLAAGPCAGEAVRAAAPDAAVLRVAPAEWDAGCDGAGPPVAEARGLVLVKSDGRTAEVLPLGLQGAPAGAAVKLSVDGSPGR